MHASTCFILIYSQSAVGSSSSASSSPGLKLVLQDITRVTGETDTVSAQIESEVEIAQVKKDKEDRLLTEVAALRAREKSKLLDQLEQPELRAELQLGC